MTDAVRIDADGPVRILTLNRPDTLNAFDDDLHAGLPQALREVTNDPKARAVVLTGAGRAFSAGGNIEDFETLANDLELRRASLRQGRQLFEDLINVHLPVVAAVNGPAVGLGCTILGTLTGAEEGGDGDRQEDGDDEHDDHELDEGETLILTLHALAKRCNH